MGDELLLVSVVIASYGREQMLRETVADVLSQAYARFEVVVVDQSKPPIDGLDSRVQVIRTRPPHLPRARNVGTRAARGSIIIFVDDDVAMPVSFLQAHAARYDDARVGGVAGRVITRANPPRPLVEAPPPADIDFDRAEPGEAHVARGCNMSFRRTALLDAGLFDEHYSSLAWSEEEDISFGVRRLGWRMVYEPHAWLIHCQSPQGGMRTESLAPFDRPEFYRDRTYFALKNVGGLDFWRVLWDMYRHTLPPRARGRQVIARHLALARGSTSGLGHFVAHAKRRTPLSYRLRS